MLKLKNPFKRSEEQRQNNDEKSLIKEIKVKQKQSDQRKEEIKKMGKLILKDGKLQRLPDTPQSGIPQPLIQSQKPLQQSAPPEESVQQNVESEPVQSQIQPPSMPTPEQLVEAQQKIMAEQQIAAQAQQQQAAPEQTLMQQQSYPQPQAQAAIMPQLVSISIEIHSGEVIDHQVAESEADDFIQTLMQAIDNKASIQIGRRVLNGQYIVKYEF